jgi:hypothetical protein
VCATEREGEREGLSDLWEFRGEAIESVCVDIIDDEVFACFGQIARHPLSHLPKADKPYALN